MDRFPNHNRRINECSSGWMQNREPRLIAEGVPKFFTIQTTSNLFRASGYAIYLFAAVLRRTSNKTLGMVRIRGFFRKLIFASDCLDSLVSPSLDSTTSRTVRIRANLDLQSLEIVW